ncbi:MAG: hypothetical protein IK151_08405 [Erysipelotrichaceae bacterium]|nr:hypothetical protein [Erysipelotrichaceae bacterium]
MNYDKMADCFATLNEKVEYALDNSNLKDIFTKLDSIEGPTLVTGVGGSSVVGVFLAKVLREKKHIISTFVYPRDLVYMDLGSYKNVIAVSYSGKNIGVDVIFDCDLNKYLLTGHERENVENIVYTMKKEESYVSVSATIVPLSILLMYYCNDRELLREILNEDIETDSNNTFYEVMSGYETKTADTILESSIIESGMAACVVHDKYNFCHGRINLSRQHKNDLIFFKMDNDLDDVLYETLHKHYNKVITINRKYEDDVINDFYSTLISLKLTRRIAENIGIDFSDMKELEDNDVFYLFKGKMR